MAALLYRAEARELATLGQLAKMHQGAALLSFLRAELTVTQTLMIDANDVNVYKLQGRARFLLDFIELLIEQSKKDHG